MDIQLKYKPYRESDFFADKRDMRPPVEGTVARGQLKEDDHYYRGMIDGKPAHSFPSSVVVNKKLLERGQNRYNIYCRSCHDGTGSGNGMVGRRMQIKPTTFHSDYMYAQPVGHFFDVITNGIRTMPSYRHQVPEADRWAIAAYIRALQLNQDPNARVSK
jgi:mono/diheme cytochrome c family protein